MNRVNEIPISETLSSQKFQVQTLRSCFLCNKLSAACDHGDADIINTMKQMLPEAHDLQNLRLDSLLQFAGTTYATLKKFTQYHHMCLKVKGDASCLVIWK